MVAKILESNPFRRSPIVGAGDTDVRELYWRMGYAIHKFNICEESFGYLYAKLVNPSLTGDVLLRSFGVIVSHQTRRTVIQEAASAYFRSHKADNCKLAKRISKLLSIYKDAASRRNDIAHGAVYGSARHIVVKKTAVPVPTEWFLVPIQAASNKREPHSFILEGVKYRYNSKAIMELAENFQALDNSITLTLEELRSFAEKLQ